MPTLVYSNENPNGYSDSFLASCEAEKNRFILRPYDNP